MAAPASDVRRSGRHDIPLGILGYTDKGIALARRARSAYRMQVAGSGHASYRRAGVNIMSCDQPLTKQPWRRAVAICAQWRIPWISEWLRTLRLLATVSP